MAAAFTPFKLNTGMADPKAVMRPLEPVKPITPAAPPAPAALPGKSWEDYSKGINWNLSDATHGFSELGKRMGYSGPVAQATGQQVYSHEGESGPVYTDQYGPNADFAKLMSGYRFEDTKDAGGNAAMNIYDAEGNLYSGENRIGSKPGTGFKIAKAVIPALTAAGFGAGALTELGGMGSLFGGGAETAGTAAAGTDAWGTAMNDFLSGLGLENVGAVGAEAGGTEALDALMGGTDLLGSLGSGYGGGAGAMSAAGSSGIGFADLFKSLGAGDLSSAGSGLWDMIKDTGGDLAAFAKKNPYLASMGLGSLATLANGSGGDPPPSPGVTGANSNAALIKALTDKLYGPDGAMSGSFDYSSVPALQTSAGDPNQFNQEAADAAYAQQTRYLDPQIAEQQRALEARLGEQGFVPGTPAYNQAMQNFMDTNQRAYAQARDSATLSGFNIGQGNFRNSLSNAELNNAASRETLAQLLAKRNQPLNELNALKTGEQLNYENQLDRYNADISSKNTTNQALSQLALALGAYFGG